MAQPPNASGANPVDALGKDSTLSACGGHALNDPQSFEAEFAWQVERFRELAGLNTGAAVKSALEAVPPTVCWPIDPPDHPNRPRGGSFLLCALSNRTKQAGRYDGERLE